MDKLIIDPEFRDKIPPLTEDEHPVGRGGLFAAHRLGRHDPGRPQPL